MIDTAIRCRGLMTIDMCVAELKDTMALDRPATKQKRTRRPRPPRSRRSIRGPWGRKYPATAQSWRRNSEAVIPFFAFPAEVRKTIYTTSAIESLSGSVRKACATRTLSRTIRLPPNWSGSRCETSPRSGRARRSHGMLPRRNWRSSSKIDSCWASDSSTGSHTEFLTTPAVTRPERQDPVTLFGGLADHAPVQVHDPHPPLVETPEPCLWRMQRERSETLKGREVVATIHGLDWLQEFEFCIADKRGYGSSSFSQARNAAIVCFRSAARADQVACPQNPA